MCCVQRTLSSKGCNYRQVPGCGGKGELKIFHHSVNCSNAECKGVDVTDLKQAVALGELGIERPCRCSVSTEEDALLCFTGLLPQGVGKSSEWGKCVSWDKVWEEIHTWGTDQNQYWFPDADFQGPKGSSQR